MHTTEGEHRSIQPGPWSVLARSILVSTMIAAVTAFSCDQRNPSLEAPVQSVHSEQNADVESPESPAPEHGGVVQSVDEYHVEIVPEPVEIWVYDRHGAPLPIDEIEGRIVIYADDDRRPYELEATGARFTPAEPFTLPMQGSAFVELTIGSHAIDVAFELPIA